MSAEIRELSLWERESLVRDLEMFEASQELTPEEEQQVQLALNEALQYAEEKRESYGLFLLKLDQQTAYAKREIERLRTRIERMESLSARLRRYGVAAIRSLGTDHKGKFRTLMGRTVSLFIRELPASVDIRNEEAVPSEYKRVTIQMPAVVYERLCSTAAPILAQYPVKDVHIDKEAVRKAIEANRDVPGADLRMKGHDHTLVVK